MDVKFTNNGHSTLAASVATSDTSITVASGHGARFPSLSGSAYFFVTLIDASNNLEIVKCTGRSSDVLTITRAQESTTARVFAIGDRIELRVTAAGLGAIYSEAVADATPAADSIVNSMIATDAVNADSIAANAVGASELNVSGNGTSGQALVSDADGTFSWSTISVAEYQAARASTTSDRSVVGVSSFVDHLSVTFTTTQVCTVLCNVDLAHGYESGAVHLHGRFDLDGSSQSNEAQVFKQGLGSNMAFGAHNMFEVFENVSAGSHTIKFQVKNYVSGTTAILNYFDTGGAGDNMLILYK